MAQIIQVEFVIEESNAPDCLAAIQKADGTADKGVEPFQIPADLIDDYADAQFEPLMLIAASVSIGFLVKRISDVWLDHKTPGGQIVDTSADGVRVLAAPHLKRGTLVLKTNDGTKVYAPAERDEAMQSLLRSVAPDA